MSDSDSDDAPVGILESDDVVVIAPKRRKKGEEEAKPPTDGILTIAIHIISISPVTSNFSKTLRNVSFEVKDAARFLSEIDPVDASNNLVLPKIGAEILHRLVISYFGEKAQDALYKISTGLEPRLMSKAQNTTNPQYNVSLIFQVEFINAYKCTRWLLFRFQYCTSGPLFYIHKGVTSVVDIDELLEVKAKKFSNKQIYIAPWHIDVGLLQVGIWQ